MKLAGFRHLLFIAFVPLMALCIPRSALAQPATLAPPQLDQLVARIALYQDPLLAQILTASTYWTEIPEAAAWADQHSYLKGDALAEAIQADHLQWDPSVLALLPFPSVLDMMAQDHGMDRAARQCCPELKEPDVMEAIQRMRRRAMSYGYLAPNGYCESLFRTAVISRSCLVNPSNDLCALLRSPRWSSPRPGRGLPLEALSALALP